MAFIILLGIAFIIILFFQSNKGKGIIGEWRVNRVLKKMALKVGGLELTDLMFEDYRSSSQIDNMLLTQKALYVVEVKNYKGMIFGNEENLNWTVTVKHVNKKKGRNGKVYKKTNISKHKFYNPIIQNKTHINKLKNLTNIHDDIPVYNIVVFGKNSIIRDITLTGTAMVVHQSKLKMLITALENNVDNEISSEKQSEIIDVLFDINIKDKKRRRKHVKDLKKKYKK